MEPHARSGEAHPESSTGPATAFEAAALPHLAAAYGVARRILADHHDAQDAVQEAYLRAWRHFHAFRGDDPRPWLLAIVRNAALTLRRRRGRDRDTAPIDVAEDLPGSGDTPEAALIRAVSQAQVREAIARLDPLFREVLVKRELEGLSYAEIAAALEVPAGTVMSRLARARAQLRQWLGDAGSEEGAP